jgi:hypothetical protein
MTLKDGFSLKRKHSSKLTSSGKKRYSLGIEQHQLNHSINIISAV